MLSHTKASSPQIPQRTEHVISGSQPCVKENSKPEAPNPTHVLSSTQGRLQAPLTYGSRFPGADSERSSRRLPSNGFPKDRFRIIVLTKICKTRGGWSGWYCFAFIQKRKQHPNPYLPSRKIHWKGTGKGRKQCCFLLTHEKPQFRFHCCSSLSG